MRRIRSSTKGAIAILAAALATAVVSWTWMVGAQEPDRVPEAAIALDVERTYAIVLSARSMADMFPR